MTSNKDSRSIGHRPYGLVRLAVNSARARGYSMPRHINRELRASLRELRATHVEKSIVELVTQSKKAIVRAIDYVLCRLADIMLARGVIMQVALLRADLLRFVHNRNQLTKLLHAVTNEEGYYQHAVIAYAKRGDMPDEIIDLVLATCRRVSRDSDIGYMLDVGERTHFHVVCGEATLNLLRERLVGYGYGLRIRTTPPEAEAKWAESGAARDLVSYLPMKLTPALQDRSIARTIEGRTGTLDHGERDFGRIVTHRRSQPVQPRQAIAACKTTTKQGKSS